MKDADCPWVVLVSSARIGGEVRAVAKSYLGKTTLMPWRMLRFCDEQPARKYIVTAVDAGARHRHTPAYLPWVPPPAPEPYHPDPGSLDVPLDPQTWPRLTNAAKGPS